MLRKLVDKESAGIQYLGRKGISISCKHAVMQVLQCGAPIDRVRVLSSSEMHCLLFTVNNTELLAVKTGFSSGYGGEGPRTFSYVLALLQRHEVEMEEYVVSPELLERVDASALTRSDVREIENLQPVRPVRWGDYIANVHWAAAEEMTLWKTFLPVIPYRIIDPRIMDLALSFWNDPDAKLMTAFRRLEGIVRKRTGLEEYGASLFSQAFVNKNAKLGWEGVDSSEQKGRGLLFANVYMAHRNPRAHHEADHNHTELLSELLLLNHLYQLEANARLVEDDT